MSVKGYVFTKESIQNLVKASARAEYQEYYNGRQSILLIIWVLGLNVIFSSLLHGPLPEIVVIFLSTASLFLFVLYLYSGGKYPYEYFLKKNSEEFDKIVYQAESRHEIDCLIQDVDCIPPPPEKEK